MKARLPKEYGKQNMNELMQKAQEMQEKMKDRQAELEETEYIGSAGAGMVEVTIKGNHQVVNVNIKPEALEEAKEDIEMLEDLIAASFNEATRIADEAADDEMNQITGEYNIPGLDI